VSSSRDRLSSAFFQARKHHPDKHQGETAQAVAQEQFIAIGEAYEILSDPEKRELYV